MDINVTNADGCAILRLRGRFDFNAHREFREAIDGVLRQEEVKSIQVDLGGVEYLDSSALGMLLMLRDRAKSSGRAASLANARGAVKQVLEIANFGRLFDIS